MTSTGGVTLIPLYAQNMLTPTVVARALHGLPPTIDLVLGYKSENSFALLHRFLSRADELVASVESQSVIHHALRMESRFLSRSRQDGWVGEPRPPHEPHSVGQQ